MAEFSRQMSQEYWHPGSGSAFQRSGTHAVADECCSICGTTFQAGARFCHVCGLSRAKEISKPKWNLLSEWMELESICERTGLSTASLALTVLAGICMLAGIMTGLVYNTATLADWQAVQIWRIEWLLATVAALLGAILFKKR